MTLRALPAGFRRRPSSPLPVGTHPPTDDGYLAPFDTSTAAWTEAGSSPGVARLADRGSERPSLRVAPEKIQSHVQRLLEFEAMAHWANYVAAHMASITNAQFLAWAGKMGLGSGRGDFHSDSLRAGARANGRLQTPQEACAWVNPADASEVISLSSARARSNSTQGDSLLTSTARP